MERRQLNYERGEGAVGGPNEGASFELGPLEGRTLGSGGFKFKIKFRFKEAL